MSLADILDPLRRPLLTVLDTPVSWTEVLGFGSGALCVWLVARRHLANWPIGIANNVFFILLFTQAGLYADAGLQVVFITLAAYGWWTWTHGGGPGSSLPVRRTTRTEWSRLLAAGVVGTLGLTLPRNWSRDLATVWHERYVGGRDAQAAEIAAIAELNGHHLWLLTDHEGVAFEDDGLRDGEELRPWMTGRFGAELVRTGRQFIRVSGSHEERLAVAVAAVDALLARGWDFAPPLPERR
ncbi:nicotinamide riboside transporter PnuC [Streptomyces sp. NPDC059743]|uniref:nicotinamide riboside transporter PnuC n=1 Tax=Streptomyces sp. NPDC059743 TaxID=3346928 RepID=UPI003669FF00